MTSLSVGITTHSEGIILHKTLLSLKQAVKPLVSHAISFEIILQLDNPTKETLDYTDRIPQLIPELPISIQTSTFGDPGKARNAIVQCAKGEYITFIDGDDLVSSSWLYDAYQILTKRSAGKPCVAHPEAVIEFGAASAIVHRTGEIDKASDSLLSVFANRWNVVLMIQRSFLLANPYPSGDGYGFEDWYINCLTIFNGFHNVLVPNTALFVRRKETNSVWLTHKTDAAVLPANPLLSFAHIRSLVSPFEKPSTSPKSLVKDSLKTYPIAHKVARRSYALLQKIRSTPKRSQPIPDWITKEWQALYTIDKSIVIDDTTPHYDSITPDHYKAALHYKEAIDSISHDSYDYIMFVPWLIKGGADLFAINYANKIAALSPYKKVLVVATTAMESPWKDKLENVDLLEFGILTKDAPDHVKVRVLEQLVENSGAKHLHIINSELAYTFVETHAHYIRGTNKTVLATSFSQSTDNTGRVFGYSHTHVPRVYNLLSYITTDNNAVQEMWVDEYGFDPKKIAVHNQPVILPNIEAGIKSPSNSLKVLWAARLSPEKQPAILLEIAKLLSDLPIEFHVYGHADENFDTSFLKSLPSSVQYHGGYNGFASLNPSHYDVYLYTSLFDGMPNSVLEAGSYGLPVVASSVGGLPDLIQSEISGILIEDLENAKLYADALRKVFDDRDLLKEYGAALRATIEKQFSPAAYEKSIKKMLTKGNYL